MEKDAPAEEQRNVSLVPNWEGLAQEMVVEILSFLPWYDLLTCKLVCKNWQSLIRDFDSLWINHCNAWGLSMSLAVPTNSSSPSNPAENQPQSAFKIFQTAMDALLHQTDPPPLYYRQHEETSSDSSSEGESYSSDDIGRRPIKAISRNREEKKESVRAGTYNTHSYALRPTNSA